MKVRSILISSLLMFAFSCGSKQTPAEQPLTVESLLEQAWDRYYNYDFRGAYDIFKQVLSINSGLSEAYFGVMLSASSLGYHSDAISNGVLAVSSLGSPIVAVAKMDTISSALLDTVVISVESQFPTVTIDGFMIYYPKYVSQNNLVIINVASIVKDEILYSFKEYDSTAIIIPFQMVINISTNDTVSNIFQAGDTVAYTLYSVNISDSLRFIQWQSSVALSNIMLINDLGYKSAEYALMAYYLKEYRTQEDNASVSRIRKIFSTDDNLITLAKIFYTLKNYYSLAKVLHIVDPAWPSWWSSDLKENVRNSYLNVDEVKSKYFEVIGNAP